jgi:hypothetical protein
MFSVVHVLAEGRGVLGVPAERKRVDVVDVLGNQDFGNRPRSLTKTIIKVGSCFPPPRF